MAQRQLYHQSPPSMGGNKAGNLECTAGLQAAHQVGECPQRLHSCFAGLCFSQGAGLVSLFASLV